MFLDVLVLGLIATLVALELALAVAVASAGKPLDRVFQLLDEQREGNFLHRIRQGGFSGLGRTAARLNDHAEDLAIRAATIPGSARSAISEIIPTGRSLCLRLSDFNDIRLALDGVGLSSSVIGITLWQGVMAAFYATAAIAGQEYAIRAASVQNRAKAVGAFVAVVYGGLFCGSALGGLLAGRFGFEAAFFTGAALAAASIVLGAASMRGRAGDREETSGDAKGPAGLRGWLTGRYLALLLGVAVPMKATMVIFIWYLTPLILSNTGSGPAEIARVLILNNIAILLLGPTVARLADGRPGPVALVVVGALGSAAVLLSLAFWSGFWAIAVAVTGVGIGQALIQTPLYALALRITGGPGPGIDALRLIERTGAIIGLAASAILLGRIGAEASIQLLGIAVLAGVAGYAIVELAGLSRST